MNKIVVIGSGVMGSGIAALLASSGIEVLLLDVEIRAAQGAIERLKSIRPAAQAAPGYIVNITPGSIDNDLPKIKDAGLVIEVIIENLAIKKSLYNKIERFMGDNTIISSNTSSIPLASLIEGRSDKFIQNFAITHFFNPPRYMKLLELVIGPDTDLKVKDKLYSFFGEMLGKEVVICKDTPGFIANRIGCYFIERGIELGIKHKVDIAAFDQSLSIIAGLPKTGIFGLADLIGLDVMSLISRSLLALLPDKDAYHKIDFYRQVIDKLIASGLTGRKGKGGFYKFTKDDKKQILVLDFASCEHKAIVEKKIESIELARLPVSNNRDLQLVWRLLQDMLLYTLNIAKDISQSICDIDLSIKSGYNWRYGPFEMIDKIGVERLIHLLSEQNIKIPELLAMADGSFYKNGCYLTYDNGYQALPVDDKIINLTEISRVLLQNEDARLLDIGNNICCFEVLTKMNCFTPSVFKLLQQSIIYARDNKWQGMVIGDNDKDFSAGANLEYFCSLIEAGDHPGIKDFIMLGQDTMMMVKYSSVPIVAAVRGVSLGGGCELMLHAGAICIDINSRFGLVETAIGLVPAWGGIKELWLRNRKDPSISLQSIKEARIFASSECLQSAPFNAKNVKIIFNDQHILYRAKEMLLNGLVPTLLASQPHLCEAGLVLSLEHVFARADLDEKSLLAIEQRLFLQASMVPGVVEKIRKIIKPVSKN